MLGKLRDTWRRRPFPTSLESLRKMRISYSQFGEDLIATLLLGYERTEGLYVDVGCYDPVQWSNTWLFYQRGWSGLCIDPHPTAAQRWKDRRPRDRFVQAGAGPRGTLHYLMYEQFPACNRLVGAAEKDAALCEEPAPQEALPVEVFPLDELLAKHLEGGGREIDLMSVDCEGMDLEVLKTNDFTRFRPQVLIVEEHGEKAAGGIHEFLIGLGYVRVASMVLSAVYAVPERARVLR